jgi:hypothetical protein
MVMPNTETESYKRLMSLDRVAGPDDPIYSGGLTMTSVRRPTPSTSGSQKSTDGQPKGNSSSAQPDPMLAAQDGLESWLTAEAKKYSTEQPAKKG